MSPSYHKSAEKKRPLRRKTSGTRALFTNTLTANRITPMTTAIELATVKGKTASVTGNRMTGESCMTGKAML